MKDTIAMKIYDTLEGLETKREQLIEQLQNKLIKSITGYELYIKTFPVFLKIKLYKYLF